MLFLLSLFHPIRLVNPRDAHPPSISATCLNVWLVSLMKLSFTIQVIRNQSEKERSQNDGAPNGASL